MRVPIKYYWWKEIPYVIYALLYALKSAIIVIIVAFAILFIVLFALEPYQLMPADPIPM